MTTLDPTEEIRAIKRKLSDACGNDIHRIAEEARHNYRASRTATVSKAPSTLSAQDTMNKMAGFFIYSLDSSAFESLTTTPTLEQGLILADALLEELEDLLDELDGEATPETWPLEREELAVLIQKRLASSDWYSGLSPGDANIWAFTLRRLMYEAGEKLGVDFRCDNDGFLYWDAAKIAAKHGAPMMGEPVFGGSGYRYLGQPRGEQDLNYSIYLPEKTRQLLGQLESAASHFETLPDEEDGDRDQFFRGLLEPVRIIVADNRVMWVQTDT